MSHSLKLDACEMKYKLGRTLGEGSFSVVKLAVDRETKKKWAVKVMLFFDAPLFVVIFCVIDYQTDEAKRY